VPGWVDGDVVAAPAVREHVLGLVDQHWGFASDVLTEIFASDADAGYRAVFSRYQRESTSAAWARRLLAACYDSTSPMTSAVSRRQPRSSTARMTVRCRSPRVNGWPPAHEAIYQAATEAERSGLGQVPGLGSRCLPVPGL
jgi:hypothetical protein